MKHSLQNSLLQYLVKHRNAYLGLAAISLALNILLSIALITSIGHERIVLVPPTINKSFWVGYNQLSSEYLVQISDFFINLRLNVSPNSAKQQRDELLHFVDPGAYEFLKNQLLQEEERLNKNHMSMVFYPVETKVDAKQVQALIVGDLTTIIGNTVSAPQRVTYKISYRYNSGKLLVKALEEVKETSNV